MVAADFGYTSNVVPVIEKIVLNMGLMSLTIKVIKQRGIWQKLPKQKPVITKARKSVAGFKIREGW